MKKYLLLQHWTSVVDELGVLSKKVTKEYAKQCNAEYKFLEGNVFHPKLCPFLQKMFILDKSFDNYDIVAMTDMDMFPRVGMTTNLFTEATGVGVCDEGNRRNAYARLLKRWPQYTSTKHPFWGGSIYRIEKHIRVALRNQFKNLGPEWSMWNIRGSGVDEAIMHRCAMLANLPMKNMHLSDDWSRGHFHPEIKTAKFIHIRNGIRKPNGDRLEKATKLENYYILKDKGLV